MKKKIYSILLAVSMWSLVVLFLSCNSQHHRKPRSWDEGTSPSLRVLSTVGMVDELVRLLADDLCERRILIQGDLDPHSYEMVKGDDELIYGADLLFYSGLGLECTPHLRRAIERHPHAISIGDSIVKQVPDALIESEGAFDPHIWMDVSLWTKGVEPIVEALSHCLPEAAALLKERGDKVKNLLLSLDQELLHTLATLPVERRYLITSHDSCYYFARRYLATDEECKDGRWRERCSSPEGLAPEAYLSSADVERVVTYLQAHQIDVIFPESNLSQESIRKIVDAGRALGLEVSLAQEPLYGDALGGEGSDGNTYEGMMRHNARVLVSALSVDGWQEASGF